MANGNNKQAQTQAKQKAIKMARNASVLESLKTIGTGMGSSIKEDLLGAGSKDIFNQLFRSRMQQKAFHGEMSPGEELPMNKVFSGEREKQEKLQRQISLERMLRDQDTQLRNQRYQEIKMHLTGIIEEIKAVAASTPELIEEVEIAKMQAPTNPGIYHVVFFERILSFVKSFRKNITQASMWLHSANSRAKKGGNVWGTNYKKSKGSYLLSPEHYLQRSAG